MRLVLVVSKESIAPVHAARVRPSTVAPRGETHALDGRTLYVRLAPEAFGTLVDQADGSTCYSVVARDTTPCSDCPLRSSESLTCWKAFADAHGYVMAEVARLSDELGRVTLRRVPYPAVDALLRAKVDRLTQESLLSPRETAVFHLLLSGNTREEIAAALGIRPRTVKFHEANLLRKVGADSRLQILQLLFT